MLFVKAEGIGILSYFKDDNAEKEQKVMAEAEFGHSPYAYFLRLSADAPPTISEISVVIAA